MLLTDEECVRSLIAIQQRHGLGVKAQPQSHCQDKGSHQLQEGRQPLNALDTTRYIWRLISGNDSGKTVELQAFTVN